MGTKVRMLVDQPVDGITYKANQVVDFPAGVAKGLKAQGVADDTAEAVAYCVKELGAEVVVHDPKKSSAGETDPAKE